MIKLILKFIKNKYEDEINQLVMLRHEKEQLLKDVQSTNEVIRAAVEIRKR